VNQSNPGPSTSSQSSSGVNLAEEVYQSSTDDDDESDADKLYIYKPGKQRKEGSTSKWLQDTDAREKQKNDDDKLMDSDLDGSDQGGQLFILLNAHSICHTCDKIVFCYKPRLIPTLCCR